MSAKVQKQGDYELFVTTHDHRILVLDGEDCYAWIEGQQSPLLVKSDSDHKKDHTESKGRFYLIDFEDDANFQDVPHLFLQKDGKYRALNLPNGLPTESNDQKRLVESDDMIPEDKLQTYTGG